MPLDDFLQSIYNHGERLIPGVTHDLAENQRHRASYAFYRKVIEADIADGKVSKPKILDLGCGVGHGCKLLAGIEGAKVVGVDHHAPSLEYARVNYAADNIEYVLADITDYCATIGKFDYIVSRGAMEHLANGLELASTLRARCRLMIDTPYNERTINTHHVLYQITEGHFDGFLPHEFFYQDLGGVMYDSDHKPARPNMILCICSAEKLGVVRA